MEIPKQKLYLASPLFNEIERRFNAELAECLEQFFRVFLPQRDGGLMTTMTNAGVAAEEAATAVFRADIQAINDCDALLIVLDGRTVDEGAAFELGYAQALRKPCYGLQTDVRRLLSTGNNPMIECSLKTIFKNIEELIAWARTFTERGPAISNRKLGVDDRSSDTKSEIALEQKHP